MTENIWFNQISVFDISAYKTFIYREWNNIIFYRIDIKIYEIYWHWINDNFD